MSRNPDPTASIAANASPTDRTESRVAAQSRSAQDEAPIRSREFADAVQEDRMRGMHMGGGEMTRMSRRAGTQPKIGGKFSVLAGPDAGKAFLCRYFENTVGRSKRCEIKTTDPTVSRRHFTVSFDFDSQDWILRDGESTSGTLVNGVPVRGDVWLKHGDIVAFGQSEMRFLRSKIVPEDKPLPALSGIDAEEDVNQDALLAADNEMDGFDGEGGTGQSRANTRAGGEYSTRSRAYTQAQGGVGQDDENNSKNGKKRPLWQIALAATLVVVSLSVAVGVGVVSYQTWRADVDQAHIDEQIQNILSDARKKIDELKPAQAKESLLAADVIDPGRSDVASLLRLADSDLSSQRALDDAKAILATGNLEKLSEATALLGRIPDSSGFALERDTVRIQIEEKQRTFSLAGIRKMIEINDKDEATLMLSDHLARYPADEDAQRLWQTLTGEVWNKNTDAQNTDTDAGIVANDAGTNGADAGTNPNTVANAGSSGNAKNNTSGNTSGSNTGLVADSTIKKAQTAFAQGDRATALAIASAAAASGNNTAKKYLSLLNSYDAALAKAQSALDRKESKAAYAAADEAYRIAQSLAGTRRGSLVAAAGQALANSLYLSFLEKMQAGKNCDGARDLFRAAEVAGGDSKIQLQLRKLEQNAQAALDRARALRNDDATAAKQLVRETVCTAPPGSKVRQELSKF